MINNATRTKEIRECTRIRQEYDITCMSASDGMKCSGESWYTRVVGTNRRSPRLLEHAEREITHDLVRLDAQFN
jgi:hypothetical protein